VLLLGGTVIVAPAVQAAQGPCDYVQSLPSGAHYGPGTLPPRFAEKAKACAAYSKRTGAAVVVTFGQYNSTVWPWSYDVFRAIKRNGGNVTFFDGRGTDLSGSCRTNNAVCVFRAGN
jgi:hypothetical protein